MSDETKRLCLRALGSFITDQETLFKISNGASLLDEGNLDSLSVVNFIVELETIFSVSFESDDLETIFSSLDKLSEYIESIQA